MRIAIGSDRARVPLKETVIAELKRLGQEVVDWARITPASRTITPTISRGEDALCSMIRPTVRCSSAVASPLRLRPTNFPAFVPGFVTIPISAHQGVEHDNMNVI